MQIQLRVRTNDIPMYSYDSPYAQCFHDAFILFDNCVEIKYGRRVDCTLSEFENTIKVFKKLNKKSINAESGEEFKKVIFMVRDVEIAENNRRVDKEELEEKIKSSKDNLEESKYKKAMEKISQNMYHFNVIEWKDRVTENRYRIVYDTVVFIMNDQGNTLRKVDG